jgi:NAD(P)-dependent dehydrogenase (short-subunit alcohol dehydrogenase family)
MTANVDCTQIKNNLLSNIYVINAFLDLVRNGKEKKIVFISSNSGDVEFTRITGMPALLGYSISKAGMNMVTTKYGIELAQEGIKTLSLSPGWVSTDAGQSIHTRPIVTAQMTDSEQLKQSQATRKYVNGFSMHSTSSTQASMDLYQ